MLFCVFVFLLCRVHYHLFRSFMLDYASATLRHLSFCIALLFCFLSLFFLFLCSLLSFSFSLFIFASLRFCFFTYTTSTVIYTLSLPVVLPIYIYSSSTIRVAPTLPFRLLIPINASTLRITAAAGTKLAGAFSPGTGNSVLGERILQP